MRKAPHGLRREAETQLIAADGAIDIVKGDIGGGNVKECSKVKAVGERELLAMRDVLRRDNRLLPMIPRDLADHLLKRKDKLTRAVDLGVEAAKEEIWNTAKRVGGR